METQLIVDEKQKHVPLQIKRTPLELLAACPSEGMVKIVQDIEKAAECRSVLISGEIGVGKNLIAEALHQSSRRRDRRIMSVDCANQNINTLRSELFGHERGAFKGAIDQYAGQLKMAHNSTLILNEVSGLPEDIQVQLIQALEGKPFHRVGGTKPFTSKVSVVAVTDRDIHKMVREGAFRSDLFFAISVFPIHVPPLRSRVEDIEYLAKYFLDQFSQSRCEFDEAALEKLKQHNWPGNVRELQNAIERAVTCSNGDAKILRKHIMFDGNLVLEQGDLMEAFNAVADLCGDMSYREVKLQLMKVMVERTLRKTRGNISEAAIILKLSRPKMYDVLDKLGLNAKTYFSDIAK